MKISIAIRLAVLLAAFAVVSALFAGFHVYQVSRDLLTSAAQERLQTTTQVLGRRMLGVLESGVRDVVYLADDENLRALLRDPNSSAGAERAEELSRHYRALMKVSPHYYQLRVIGASDNGMERVRVDREANGQVLRVDGMDLQEKGHFDYVRDGLAQREQVYLSRFVVNHEAGAHGGSEAPTLRIAAQVREPSGRVLGLVVVNLTLTGLFNFLGEDLPHDHELYLTDARGEYLVHPDAQQAFAFDRGQSSRVQMQFPETANLFTGEKRAVHISEATQRDGKNRQVAAAFVRVNASSIDPRRFFVIGLAQARDEVLKTTHELLLAVIPVVLLFCVIAVLSAMFLSRRVTRPLRQMARVVRSFPHQQIRPDLPIDRGDEIGTLASGLVQMQDDILQKMDELHAQRNELAHLAGHDSLTGLPNRLLFTDRAEQALARSRRTGEELALLFIDLDRFKAINDRHGHAAGDFVLTTIAHRLRATVRQMDTVARFGGDEFVVLLETTGGTDFLEVVASKLVDAITPEIVWQNHHLMLGASIGIACFPRDGDSIDALCSHADHAMYRVKGQGGSSYQFADGQPAQAAADSLP